MSRNAEVVWGLVVGLLMAGLLWLPERLHMNGYVHALLFTGAALVLGLISRWLFPRETGLSLKESFKRAFVPLLQVVIGMGLCFVVATGLFLLSSKTEGTLSDYISGAAAAILIAGPIVVASWYTYTVIREVRRECSREDRSPVSQ